MNMIGHVFKTGWKFDGVRPQSVINASGSVTAVIKNYIFITISIKFQFLDLADDFLCKGFGIAASESVPAVPAHCRKAAFLIRKDFFVT